MTVTLPAALATGEWRDWEPEQKALLLDRLAAARAARTAQQHVLYPWQRPHTHPPDRPPGPCTAACDQLPRAHVPPMGTFLQRGGRGTGKTDGAAQYVLDHVTGPRCGDGTRKPHRMMILGPTLGDAVEAVSGDSGLQRYDPRVTLTTNAGGTFARFPDGSEAVLRGAATKRDIDLVRAKAANRCLVWVEEAAAIPLLGLAIDIVTPGLRFGPRPHYVMSTTPKNRPDLLTILRDPLTVSTWGITRDAHHLTPEVRAKLEARYAGTRLGRQELDGEVLEDVEGALWRQWLIDRDRHKGGAQGMPAMRRVVVAVDPNAGGPDECGIVAVGVAHDKAPDLQGRDQWHAYVLADRSDHYAHPGEWAAAACKLYDELAADAIVAEVNNGGDMVGHVIHTHDRAVRYRAVRATRGKAVRAEPVVALYEQGRVHHAGQYPQLEEQMTTWTEDSPGSPDRMDALVWALTDLLLRGTSGNRAGVA